MTADAGNRHGSERAVDKFRALGAPYRFRVEADAEGFPIIPGRYGQIEWYCDGVNCHSCALPGQFALAVYTKRPRLFSTIWAIPGVKKHQTGDWTCPGSVDGELLSRSSLHPLRGGVPR